MRLGCYWSHPLGLAREDLPLEYLNAPDLMINLKKLSGSKGNTRPVVGIPVAQIKEIRLHRIVDFDEPFSMKGSIIAGASGGFLFGISCMLGDSYGEWFPRVPVYDDSPSFMEFLIVGTVSAAVGAVALPVFRHLEKASLKSNTVEGMMIGGVGDSLC